MALEDIVRNIKAKATQEAERIKEEADKEGKEIIKKAREEADRIKKRIFHQLESQAQDEKRKLVIRTRSDERKKLLVLKRELIDEVFRQAEQKLSSLEKAEYLSLIKKSLLSHIDSGKEEIIVSPRDEKWMEGNFIKSLRESLKDFGTPPEVRLSPKLEPQERGFILKMRDAQINCTFSSLFLSLRDELEIEVARKLFS
ncbi:MAG: V-type ATP synthase subunit E [bacterium]